MEAKRKLFTRNNRVRKSSDFAFVRLKSLKADCSAFVVYGKVVEDFPRIAIVASRKVGNAVVRNYAKRIFREFFREYISVSEKKVAVIVYLRRGYNKFTFEDLKSKLYGALDNIKDSKK